jgi:hypothetical protein
MMTEFLPLLLLQRFQLLWSASLHILWFSRTGQ